MKSKKPKNEELRFYFFFQNQKNLFGLVCGWGVFCFVFRISVKKLANKSGFSPQHKKKYVTQIF